MLRRCVLTLACVVLVAVAARAQETTIGSIAAKVVDTQNLPVPGATVTLTTPQGPRTFVTDANGAFFAPYLTPGIYAIKIALQGFRTLDRQNIDVRLGQRVELTLPMQVGALTESVNVTGGAPVVDVSSTTTGVVLDSEMLQRVPIGRRFSDTLYIAPGVSSGGQVGDANPSVSGGSGLESSYVNEVVAGLEFEALPKMNVGVRYIHRDIPRVLEDVQPFPIVAGDLGIPGASSVDYVLTNPVRTRRRAAISARRSRRRLIATTRSSSPPTSASRIAGRCRRRIATRGCGAPSRASSATTMGSRIPGSRRSSTSRPTIRATRRSACRSSAIAATCVSSARSARGRCRSIARTR
jgi:hypothetical protein